MKNIARLRALSALILAACLLPPGAPGAAAAEAGVRLPILGVDPLPQGMVVENHADALSRWVEHGIAGAVLLHVDTSSGLRNLPADNLAALRKLRDAGDLDGLRRGGRGGASGLFNDGNLVRAAAALGIVREVVWIMPFGFPGESDAGERLKSVLGNEGLSAEDIATFLPADGSFRGTVGGLPVTICGQERLPRLADPVVLSLDFAFFPYAADHHGLSLLSEIGFFFSALRSARYPVQDATVAYSIDPRRLIVELRWVGEAVAEALRDPTLVLRAEPPERWDALQRLFLLTTTGRDEGEALNMALSLLQRHPLDPALLLFAAEASARHGGGLAALSYAEQACRLDPGYCAGLRQIGLLYLGRGDIELGERFFATAERILPGMDYGEFDRGLALLRAGRREEGLKGLETAVERDGEFPGGFVIGALKAAEGDRAAARLAFDKAVAAVAQGAGLLVVQPEVAEAIRRAAAFYHEEGLTREAEMLESDPRLQLPRPDAAP